jgi:hypothetical protein
MATCKIFYRTYFFTQVFEGLESGAENTAMCKIFYQSYFFNPSFFEGLESSAENTYSIEQC